MRPRHEPYQVQKGTNQAQSCPRNEVRYRARCLDGCSHPRDHWVCLHPHCSSSSSSSLCISTCSLIIIESLTLWSDQVSIDDFKRVLGCDADMTSQLTKLVFAVPGNFATQQLSGWESYRVVILSSVLNMSRSTFDPSVLPPSLGNLSRVQSLGMTIAQNGNL